VLCGALRAQQPNGKKAHNRKSRHTRTETAEKANRCRTRVKAATNGESGNCRAPRRTLRETVMGDWRA